ncbi:nitrogen regulatory protein P-II [Spirochaetia bacterium]|nr:nitrogen regulatory protein P-II [Spirochaetia bacterium]
MAKTIRAKSDQIRLKALFLIADWDKLQAISEVFAKEDCLLSFVSKGSGTASSEIINLLGIGATDKAVFICLVQSTETPHIIQEVRRVMGTGSAGAGIAFSIPLGGITARIFSMFEQTARGADAEKPNTREDRNMNPIEIKNEMIVSILNQGNSEAFMTEARKAGARGGTVISARGISQEMMKKFLGMSVQDEKEIIFILADKDKSAPIMQAVVPGFGVSTKAAGVFFSLPVDQVMSLNALS